MILKKMRLLKHYTFENGYLFVSLFNNKTEKFKNYCVHILIYDTFFNNYDKNKVIGHKDLNKHNNHINNLKCVARNENSQYVFNNHPNIIKNRTIEIINKKTNEIIEVIGVNKCCEFLNCDKTQFIKYINNEIEHEFYIIQYKTKEKKQINKIDDLTNFKSLGIIKQKNFSNYFINQSGCVVNTTNHNKIVKPTMQGTYYVVNLSCNKIKTEERLHRLLAKVFLEDGEKYFNDTNYVVNHKDHNRINNSLDNLEWVTVQRNNEHGCGKKVSQYNMDGKLVKIYPSLAAASRESGYATVSIAKCCLGKVKTCKNFIWRYDDV